MRVLVCGSRKWTDDEPIRAELEGLHLTGRLSEIIHGGQRGADTIAGYHGRSLGVKVTPVHADWPPLGSSRWAFVRAARERNERMLALGPDLVLAFKDGFDWTLSSGGTEHMVSLVQAANVPFQVIDRTGLRLFDLL